MAFKMKGPTFFGKKSPITYTVSGEGVIDADSAKDDLSKLEEDDTDTSEKSLGGDEDESGGKKALKSASTALAGALVSSMSAPPAQRTGNYQKGFKETKIGV